MHTLLVNGFKIVFMYTMNTIKIRIVSNLLHYHTQHASSPPHKEPALLICIV